MKHHSIGRVRIGRLRTSIVAVLALVLCAMPTAASAVSVSSSTQEQDMFQSAASEFNVPLSLLMSISYNQSRWEDHNGQMSVDGGYGPMNLRTAVAVQDERGDPSRPVPQGKVVAPKGDMTLDNAAKLLNVNPDTLKTDMRQNIRGGAALLADQAKKQNNGALPANLDQWYAVVAQYLGSTNSQNTQSFVEQVVGMMKNGHVDTTSKGQQLSLAPTPNAPSLDINKLLQGGKGAVGALGLNKDGAQNNNGAECPRTDNCRFIPAGYAANSADPADYGNYDYANRPKDMKVNYIVIHDTEGSYESAISHFQDTSSYVSAHYVIRSSDGAVTQMVPTSGVAWHAGDWYMNMHSIGIEHEGYAALGGSWYTEAMYQSSANLVKYLAKKYDIPLDRDHILGHDNIPGLTDKKASVMHWDPGPYWDWNHYMELLTGKQTNNSHFATNNHTTGFDGNGWGKNAVTITPNFAKNVQTVNACIDATKPETCADLTAPSNFVYLRTEPRADAPLITDTLLHPGGMPGSTKIDDWTAKATTGQQYAVAEKRGDWTAIWFSNQKAWFYNPSSQPAAASLNARTVTLKPGLTTAHTYGGAYPEASVYPANVAGPAQTQLSYVISQGQKYVSDGVVPTDYFYDATLDYSKPHDHEIFTGQDRFIKIWYNQRVMFVKASDVVVQ